MHARFAAIGGAEFEVPPRRELPRAAVWESADLAEAGLHHDKTAASCIRVTHMSAPAPTPGTLVITSAIENGTASIALAGELDLSGARQLEMRLDEAERESPERLVIDLRELSFIDSTGLRLLLQADARARERGCELVLRPGEPTVQRVFEVTGALDVLRFED